MTNMARHLIDLKTCFSIGSLEPIIAQIISNDPDYYGVWDIRIAKNQNVAKLVVSFTVNAGHYVEISVKYEDCEYIFARDFNYYYRYTWEEVTQSGFPGSICDILKSLNYTIYLMELDYNKRNGSIEKCHIDLVY